MKQKVAAKKKTLQQPVKNAVAAISLQRIRRKVAEIVMTIAIVQLRFQVMP
ncbi:hypothetical protein [Taibaiella lutea]|uniref:hypothetical protein n=1 Tax=Taibaiella lutea TaxID=2608001 RepID=UPI00167FE04E|nr:hypothetical protein [Taibaiella lutea]